MQPIVRRRFNSRHAAAVLLGGLSLLSACDKQTAKAAGNTAPLRPRAMQSVRASLGDASPRNSAFQSLDAEPRPP